MDMKYVLVLLVGWVVLSLVASVRSGASTRRPPMLTVDPPMEVGRTSAVLTGRVEIPGNSRIDFCRFCYGTAPDRIQSVDCPVESGVVAFRLEGLEPGTAYFYYIEAGTEASRVMSAMGEFTTLPE